MFLGGQFRIKIDKKSIQKSFKIGAQFIVHHGSQHGSQNPPKTRPKSSQNPPRTLPEPPFKTEREKKTIFSDFFSIFGGPGASQNREKSKKKL